MKPLSKAATLMAITSVLGAGLSLAGPSGAAIDRVITDGDRARIAAAVAKRERKAARRLAEAKRAG
jgi:hypothetical protein